MAYRKSATIIGLLTSKKILLIVLAATICAVLYFQFFHSVTINPVAEAVQMKALELAKQQYVLEPFSSDGCSGNVSNLWESAVTTLSSQFPLFA